MTIHLSLWKPLNVPSAGTLDILDHELKPVEVESGDGIEADIE